jgi:hypothetical protein
MLINLFYRGPLRSNGDARHKHELRMHFHDQLNTLWSQAPLDAERREAFSPPFKPEASPGMVNKIGETMFPSLVHNVGQYSFVPLVSTRLFAVVDLDITLLRPQSPGSIVSSGGDIDNRIKTLLDALALPDANQLNGIGPISQNPLLCLLEDDMLIHRITVSAEQLLEPLSDRSEVVTIVRVTTHRTQVTRHNDFIA